MRKKKTSPTKAKTRASGQTETLENSLLQLMSGTGEIAYVWDLDSDRIQWINKPSDTTVEFIISVETGRSFNEMIDKHDQSVRRDKLGHTLTENAPVELGYQILKEDGNAHWVQERASVMFSESGEPEKIVGSIRLMETGHIMPRPHEQIDQLTGLYNENKLRQSLDALIPEAQKNKTPGCYIIVGIDKLSIINDVYGPQTAEEVVIGIGGLLKKCVRPQDIIGRVNTDHFGIILNECGIDGQTLIVENILNTVRHTALETQRGSLKITVSIGSVLFPTHAKTTQDVFIRGESALNTAKRSGRNCYKIFSYTKDSQTVQERTIEIADHVRRAIDEKLFDFAFQPVVCPHTRAIKFYEMLLRIRHSDTRIIRAQEFIQVAEQLGLTKQIDTIVLNHAMALLAAHKNIHLSINISAFNANDGEWLKALMSHVYAHEDLAHRLIIEITETAALHDEKEAIKFIRIVRSMGCRVALDDFGEGYTGFKQLKTLPIDIIKIDGSFIHGIANNNGKQLFIKTLLELADGYGMTVVAECIENREEFEILKAFGMHLQQGYYLGRPALLPAEKLEEFFGHKTIELEKAD